MRLVFFARQGFLEVAQQLLLRLLELARHIHADAHEQVSLAIAPQHLDITQSWVAWGLGYTKVNSKEYMKMAIPTSWIICFILSIAVYVMYGGLV